MTKPPRRIIALDIETNIPDPRGMVEECQPFLLGIKHYRIEAGALVPEDYRSLEISDFARALREVSSCPGLIVGYNLFGFDYVVLRPWLQDTTIVERTVDLFALLRAGGTRHTRELKLHSVCKALLGEGKVDLGIEASVAWQNGNRDLVLRYNERDCDLAAGLWHFLLSARTVSLGRTTLQIGHAERRTLTTGGQFNGYDEWLAKEFSAQTARVRADPFVGINVNPLDLAREFDRFVCKSTGKIFYSRLIPATDYPSGEDVAPRSCPACGEYVFDSPYVFKGWVGGGDGSPSREGVLEATQQLEALWSKIARLVAAGDRGPHFATTEFPRSPTQEVRLEDYLGVTEDDFDAWVGTIQTEEIKGYIPRWRHERRWAHRRSLRALEQYMVKMGLP